MKTVAIIQARCGSTRFPNKVFSIINGKPLIWHVVKRAKSASLVDKVVLATTIKPNDDSLVKWADDNDICYFRGNEENVLSRFYGAAKQYEADIIVRITADDPFKEPSLIDSVICKLKKEKLDLATNIFPPSYPEGLDVEAFTYKALKIAQEEVVDNFEQEHLTQFFYHNLSRFRIGNVAYTKNLSYLRWTIDTEEDLQMVRTIYSYTDLKQNNILHMDEILDIISNHPEISAINNHVNRSTMYQTKLKYE